MELVKDIASFAPIQTARRGCLGMCGNGPNCLLEQPGKRQAISRLDSFSKIVSLVKKVLKDTSSLQPDLLEKARLKSDAIRIIARSSFRPEQTREDMGKAIGLLSHAMEQEIREGPKMSARLRSLYLLRGRAFGKRLLALPGLPESESDKAQDASAALSDFKAVLAEDPSCPEAFAEAGHIYGFTGQTAEALEWYQRALDLMPSGSSEASQISRRMKRLKEGRLAAGSGDGSGLWKVRGISGLSPDTCIYHLETLPPADPHPCPHAAWHVQVAHGSTIREYTPVSSASAWEAGCMDLLVKTYPSGTVSKFFGSLQTAEEAQESCLQSYGLLEEQNCWVRVSAPILTFDLRELREVPSLGLVIVAGGTGIAPAIQIMSEVVNTDGSLKGCPAQLLYSSRTPRDVLMLDELRAFVESRRVQVTHTLTQEGRRAVGSHFRGKHGHFSASYVPKDGPLRPEEVAFHRRVDMDMLKAVLDTQGPAAPAAFVIVCGPQGLLDASEKCLMELGHQRDRILLLRATATEAAELKDSSEESEGEGQSDVSQDELDVLPAISVSPPQITISAPASVDKPGQGKPGDILRAQLSAGGSPAPSLAPSAHSAPLSSSPGSPGPSLGTLTFADRVRQEREATKNDTSDLFCCVWIDCAHS